MLFRKEKAMQWDLDHPALCHGGVIISSAMDTSLFGTISLNGKGKVEAEQYERCI